MLIRIATVTALSALTFGATAAMAEQTLSYGSYLEYDYDYEDNSDEVILGGYAEIEFNSGFFAGLEVYTVDDDPDSYGYDASLGYRGDAGMFSYEFAYYDYNLDDSGADGDELEVSIDYTALGLVMSSSIGTELDGDYSIGQDFGLILPADYSVALGLDYHFDEDVADWEISASKALTDTVSLTAGLDGTFESENPEAYFVVAFDTSKILDY